MKKSLILAAAVSVAAAAMVTAFGAGTASAAACTASADPPQNQTYNGWGDQTTQDIYGAFTNGYAFNGNNYVPDPFAKNVGSWNSINPNTCSLTDIVTPVVGGDAFQRPNGSVDARAALSAAWGPRNSWVSVITGLVNALNAAAAVKQQEITFVRSFSVPSALVAAGGANDHLSYIPQAKDAVGVAEQVNGTAQTATNFTTGALTGIYTDQSYTQNAGGTTVGDIQLKGLGGGVCGGAVQCYPWVVTAVGRNGVATSFPVVPVLPEASAGIRSFFLTAINAAAYSKPVVANENGNVAQEENNARADLAIASVNAALALNNPAYSVPANSIEIVPFSGAQYIEQAHGLAALNTTVGFTFPTINGLTLFIGAGVSAAPGSLNTAETPAPGMVGDFASYVYAVIPIVGANVNLVKWLDNTLPAAMNGPNSVWSDYGFVPVGAAFAGNPANWLHSDWQN